MIKNSKVLITGGTGMVGSALLRRLREEDYQILHPARAELDLRDQLQVTQYFSHHKPAYVFHLAAIVGGIHANNTYPAKFIYDNTQMHCNVIHAAHQYGVKKLLFPGSACTYPKLAPQPIREASFLDGYIEPTNIAYAAAKINGIIMCQAYARQHQMNTVIPMPTNAYGINDNFDPNASHVIPALMKRFHEAKVQGLPEVVLWGSGTPLREFIYVDDFADALLFLMRHYHSADIINLGTMQEITIADLANEIACVVGYPGRITLDKTKPDGAPRKCLDSSVLFEMGWKPSVSLQEGLFRMYQHHFGSETECADTTKACGSLPHTP
ncbi:GDP-L-fucose synthase [Aquicella siphonis]|uniref:GDP-L-fucose synthase n=1 Tax=Aquicella siphonis TaxID=254247 RepID=A0A5E4PJ84_9COXI|nr:GDP-L-fucose synthase [Aquicella siphonis]VVC76497.1 GDP-L-fucose synthase [Aquicella siphonis]